MQFPVRKHTVDVHQQTADGFQSGLQAMSGRRTGAAFIPRSRRARGFQFHWPTL
jgi:hypothetical protein